MKGNLFCNSFFQGTIKKCTDDALPESLETTTVKKEAALNIGNIINRWKRDIAVGHYGSVCSGFFPKGDTELQYSSPGNNAIRNFGLHRTYVKY